MASIVHANKETTQLKSVRQEMHQSLLGHGGVPQTEDHANLTDPEGCLSEM